MAQKRALTAIDRTLPVIMKSTAADELNAYLKSSLEIGMSQC